jgi:hypothetical protein
MNLLVLALILLLNNPVLELSPAEWDFGTITRDAGIVEQSVRLINHTDDNLTVRLMSTCSCLVVAPEIVVLEAGQEGSFRLTFDPVLDEGPVERHLIVRTDSPDLPKGLFVLRGEVTVAEKSETGTPAGPPAAAAADENTYSKTIQLDYYYSAGCSSCQRFLTRTIPKLERSLDLSLEIKQHDILDPQVYTRYQTVLESLGVEERAYPALVLGYVILQGDREIEAQLETLLASGEYSTAGDPAERIGIKLALLPVLAAGLLDGINPCAFTTLIFLISALAVAGRSRREVLQIGLFFSLAVFASYFLIGLGLFQALRAAQAFPLIAQVIKWILFAGLLALAALSMYDFFALRSGRTDKVLLQLPQAFKKRIHRTIRTRVRSLALISSALVLGFLVSVFELACTGQVYFPTIAYLVQVKRTSGYGYLLLYNAGFIFPLLVVFALTYLGISSKAVTATFQKGMKFVKLSLAVLFLGLAAITFFT